MTWDRRLYFPSEGRRAEDFFALKNPTASTGFEPANLSTKGQHATPRPPKPKTAYTQKKMSSYTVVFRKDDPVSFSYLRKWQTYISDRTQHLLDQCPTHICVETIIPQTQKLWVCVIIAILHRNRHTVVIVYFVRTNCSYMYVTIQW